MNVLFHESRVTYIRADGFMSQSRTLHTSCNRLNTITFATERALQKCSCGLCLVAWLEFNHFDMHEDSVNFGFLIIFLVCTRRKQNHPQFQHVTPLADVYVHHKPPVHTRMERQWEQHTSQAQTSYLKPSLAHRTSRARGPGVRGLIVPTPDHLLSLLGFLLCLHTQLECVCQTFSICAHCSSEALSYHVR